MGKKSKAKFKRQMKNQVLNQMAQVNAGASSTGNSTSIAAESITTSVPNTKKSNPIVIPEMQNLPQIKADLRKTVIVIAVLIICVIALVLFDQKSHVLLTFGNWLFKVLHIQ